MSQTLASIKAIRDEGLAGAAAGSDCGHLQPYPRELERVPPRECVDCKADLDWDYQRAMWKLEEA